VQEMLLLIASCLEHLCWALQHVSAPRYYTGTKGEVAWIQQCCVFVKYRGVPCWLEPDRGNLAALLRVGAM